MTDMANRVSVHRHAGGDDDDDAPTLEQPRPPFEEGAQPLADEATLKFLKPAPRDPSRASPRSSRSPPRRAVREPHRHEEANLSSPGRVPWILPSRRRATPELPYQERQRRDRARALEREMPSIIVQADGFVGDEVPTRPEPVYFRHGGSTPAWLLRHEGVAPPTSPSPPHHHLPSKRAERGAHETVVVDQRRARAPQKVNVGVDSSAKKTWRDAVLLLLLSVVFVLLLYSVGRFDVSSSSPSRSEAAGAPRTIRVDR